MRFFSDNADYYLAIRRYEENFSLDEVDRSKECTKGILLPREDKIPLPGQIKGVDDTAGSPLPLPTPIKEGE